MPARYIAIALLSSAAPAAASDVPPDFGSESAVFEDVAPFVVGASRRRQSLEDVPESVTVITGEEIRRFGWRTITDVLANVRGLYVTNDHNYSYLGVRGFARPGDYNTRVLVLVNGHATNDSIYGASMLGREFGVDMDLVERIEVIRGPGSALYGTSALLAVINVVTRTGPDVRHLEGTGLRASAEKSGATNTKTAIAVDKLIGEKLRFLASGSYETGTGRSLDLLGEDGVRSRSVPGSDAVDATNAFAALSYGPLSVMGMVNHYDKMIPTASFGSLPDAGEQTHDVRALLEAKLELSPIEDVDFSARAFLDYSLYEGFYPYTIYDGGNFNDSTVSLGAGADATATWRPSEKILLTAGATALRSFYNDMNTALPAVDFYFHDRRAYSTLALYSNAELRLLPELSLITGIRYDWYGTFGDRSSPRLALVLRPVPGSTLKLMYGEAFRAPSIYELYYEGGGNNANPALQPEVLRHVVAIAEQDLDGHGLFTLAFYHYSIDELIDAHEFDENALTFKNTGSARAIGADLEISGRLPFLGIRGAVGYTFSNVTDAEAGKRLSNSPQHVLQLRASAPIYENSIFLALAARYVGERPGLDGRLSAEGAFTADLTLTADDVADGFDLSAGVTNLFDGNWMVPGSIEHAQDLLPQDGRTVWAKISYLF